MNASRDFDGTGHAAEMAAHAHDEATPLTGEEIRAIEAARERWPENMAAALWPDEFPTTRLIVSGEAIPPYDGAVAYLRSAADEYGIEYEDGRVDWLGCDAHRAFGDDATIEVHPDSLAGRPMAIRDELQTWNTHDLIDMIACVRRETWLAEVVRNELAARGVDHKGNWCGFPRAREIWRG